MDFLSLSDDLMQAVMSRLLSFRALQRASSTCQSLRAASTTMLQEHVQIRAAVVEKLGTTDLDQRRFYYRAAAQTVKDGQSYRQCGV